MYNILPEVKKTPSNANGSIVTKSPGATFSVVFDTGGAGCFEQPTQLAFNKTYDGVPLLAPCSGLQTYDYFTGSEVSFILSFLALAACCPSKFIMFY